MKLYKMLMVLIVVALCTVGSLWILGLIGGAEASEGITKVVSLIVILGLGVGALFVITSGSEKQSSESSDLNQQGPKF